MIKNANNKSNIPLVKSQGLILSTLVYKIAKKNES